MFLTEISLVGIGGVAVSGLPCQSGQADGDQPLSEMLD
jgi:hypothetical protein